VFCVVLKSEGVSNAARVTAACRLARDATLSASFFLRSCLSSVEITADADDEIDLFNVGPDPITLHVAPAIGATVEIQKLAEPG
jgi:hypothetical protein